LLSGGQRIAQLVRLHTANIYEKKHYFVLFDGKGRPGTGAREHWVPLTTPLLKALRECKPTGEFYQILTKNARQTNRGAKS
jgi:integrase